MINRTCVAFLLVVTLAGVEPASADWQYTHWGMTRDEVVAASQGSAGDLAPEEKPRSAWGYEDSTELLLQAPYEAGRFKFTAFFFFDKTDHRLAAVELRLEKGLLGSRSELRESLLEKYGKPASERTGVLRQVVWRTDTDSITLLEFSDLGVLVVYAPIRSAEQDKL